MSYSEAKEGLRTVAFTVATPFTDDCEAVDHDGLAENLSYLEDAGAQLYIPCGNTGEYYALSDDERVAVTETTVEAVGEGSVVFSGAGGSVKRVSSLIEQYEAVGVDGAMVMHPDHTHMHRRGLVEYYREIADGTDLPLIVYKRGAELDRDVLGEITQLENVVAIKYADADIAEFAASVNDTDADVVWINGLAERYAPAFALEWADGFTTGIGNFLPELTLSLWEAIRAEEWDRVHSIRERIRPLEDIRDETGADNDIDSANNVPVVKHGMDIVGLSGGPVRAPLVDLSDRDAKRVSDHCERLLQSV